MEFHIWTSLLSSLFPHCTSRNHTMFSGLLFGHAVGLRLPSHFHGNFSFSQCYCKVSRCPDLHKNCVIAFPDTEIADRPVAPEDSTAVWKNKGKWMLKEVRYTTWNGLNVIFLIFIKIHLELTLSHFEKVQTVSGAYPFSYSNGTEGCLPGVKHPDLDADHSLHLAPI